MNLFLSMMKIVNNFFFNGKVSCQSFPISILCGFETTEKTNVFCHFFSFCLDCIISHPFQLKLFKLSLSLLWLYRFLHINSIKPTHRTTKKTKKKQMKIVSPSHFKKIPSSFILYPSAVCLFLRVSLR